MVVLATSWLMLFAIQGCESKQNWETYLAAGRLQLEKGKVDVAERLFLEAYEEPETGDRTYFEPDKNSLLARSFRGLGHHYLLKDCNYEKALKNWLMATNCG
jgi:hypothetical protein